MELRNGHPFWGVRSGLLGVYPRLDRDLDCDVAIIGGGITGALMAREAARRGWDCAVVDRNDIGFGSTCASTSLLLYDIDEHLTDLAKAHGQEKANRAYLSCFKIMKNLPDVVTDGGGEDFCEFGWKDSVYFASRKRDLKSMDLEFQARQELGLPVEWLDQSEFESRFSFSAPGAIVSHGAAEVDAFRLTHGLVAFAAERGVRIFDRTNVDKIKHTKSGVELTTEHGCQLRARKLIMAAGYESQDYIKQHVASNRNTYAFVSEPLNSTEGWWELAHLWETARPYLYLRSTKDNRMIVGGEDEVFSNSARRDRVLEKKTARLLERVREMFPAMTIEPAFSWAGTFSETKDALPRIGTVKSWPNTWFAMGYGGNGITFSMLAARVIANAIDGKPDVDSDLFAFE